MIPKTTDIEYTHTGYARLSCDGRHANVYHFFCFYSKREIIKLWKKDHPTKGEKTT